MRIMISLQFRATLNYHLHCQGPCLEKYMTAFKWLTLNFLNSEVKTLLNQRCIENPVEHLLWSFIFAKIVNDF